MNKNKYTKDQLVEMVLEERQKSADLQKEVERLAPFESKYKICKDARKDEKDLRKLTVEKGEEIIALKTQHKLEIDSLVTQYNNGLVSNKETFTRQIMGLQKQLQNQNGTILDLFDLIDLEHETKKRYFRKYKEIFITIPPAEVESK